MKPKFRPLQSSSVRRLSTLVVMSFAAASSAFAASATWNGTTDATWATPTNWSATPVPGTGDTATFDNAGNANTTIDLGAGVTVGNLSFATATAAAYTIGSGGAGSQTLTLNGSGAISMGNLVANNQLINANVSLGNSAGAQAFTFSNLKTTVNTLTFAGAVSTAQTGVKTLTIDAAGITSISGAISDGSGTLSLNKTGTNLLTLSGSNGYSGGTLISGILNAASSTALGTGSVAVNNGAGNQLQLGNGVNVANPLTVNGGGITGQSVLYVPTGSATYSGTIALNAPTSAGGYFASAGQTSKLTIAGDNTITTATEVTIRNGWVNITGAQNYTTGTSLGNANSGIVQFGKTTSMPASGTVTLTSGNTLAVNAGGAGEFTPGAGAGTIGGLLAGTGGQGAPVTLPAGTSIAIDTTNAPGTVAATSAWTSTNNVGLLKLGTGTLSLSNGGTYVGGGYGGFPFIARQGTTLLNGGTHTVTGELVVGGTFGTANGAPGLDATLQVDSGTLAVSSWLSIGRGNGTGTATSNLIANNNAAITSANFSAGYNANSGANLPKATFTLNGTSSYTLTGNGAFNFAESTGSHMTMTINDSASVTAAGTAVKNIGQGGTGVLTVNGGSLNFGNGTINVGNNGATGGTLNINGGAVTTGTGGTPLFNIGYRNGTGTLTMTGGTFNHTGEVRVAGSDVSGADNGTGFANFSGGTATMNGLSFARGNNNQALNNGTGTISGTAVVNSIGDVTLGYAGAGNLGKLTMSGGTLNVGTTGLRWLRVGVWDTSKGELNLSGGNINLNNGSHLKMNAEGTTGANVVNQSGGTITTYSDNGITIGGAGHIDLQRGGGASSNNTYNFTGGTIVANSVITSNDAGTAAFNFGGGTLKATANNANFFILGGATQTANVLAGGAKFDTNGFNVTVAQPLLSGTAGDGGLLKLGAGALTLTGANTYNGPTTINGGTLNLAASTDVGDSSGITINGSGAKLGLGNYQAGSGPVTLTQGSIEGYGTVGSIQVANNVANTITVNGGGNFDDLEVASLTFAGAATLNLSATGDAITQSIYVVDDLTTNAAGDVVINATNTNGVWLPGDYTIAFYDGDFIGSTSDFAVGTIAGLDNAHQTASIVDIGGEIVLRIEGDTLTWTGEENSNWTTGTVGGARNWWYPSDTTTAEFSNGSPVLFDDTASNENVILTSNVEPAAIIFDNSFNDYNVSGSFAIAGGGTLTKNGTGMLTISTANTYTGVTTLNGGTVEITGAGTIGSSSEIIVGADADLILSPTGAVTYANPISGAGTLTKNGAGTLTLSGANTLTGDVTLNAGQLNLNSAGALGGSAGTPAGAFIINGGVLDNTSGTTQNLAPNKPVTLNSDISFIGSNNLYLSNGLVTLTGNRTVNVQAGLFGMGAPVDDANTFNLVKTGPGNLVLNGCDIGGNLDVQAGIVGINQNLFAAAPLGTGILQNAGNVGSRTSHWNPASDVTSGLLFRNNDGSSNFQLGIIKRGPSALTLTNASNNATSQLNVDQGRLVLNAGTYGARNDDGTTNTNLISYVGWDAGVNSVLEINGATVNYNSRSAGGDAAFRSTLNVADKSTSVASVKLNSGSLSINRQLALGITGDAFGAMTQTGGTTDVGGFLALGLGTSRGVFNLSGGTFNHAGPVTNGAGGNSIGVMNLGGTGVYNQTSVGDLGLWLGENGSGTLNVSGNASLSIVAANNGLQLGRNASGVGIANLNGGTVTVQKVYKGAGSGTLNFGGGTLAANTATANFLTGLTAAYVNAGGGTISNGGNAITIGQALMAPTGGGVTAAGISASGAGFIDTPIVTITGDGTGATAVANVDSGGNLTGITITNPGVGYTSATVTLVGGGVGNTGNITGAPVIAANTSGGMTFSGGATTTLTAVNTYTGNTTINTGTTLAVPTGAAITVKPTTNNTSSKITGAGTLSMVGSLRIDLSSAAIANGNVWNVVDVTNKVYTPGFFNVTSTVGAFVEQGDGINHILVDGDNTWTFNETSGQLSLSVAASGGFDSWIDDFGLAEADQDPTDDPDNDGVANMVEYYLGRDPSVSDGPVSTVAKNGNNLVLTFQRSDLSETNGDVTGSIEYGNNLVGWTAVEVPATSGTVGGVTFTITDGTPNDTVSASIPTGGDPRFFGRVKVVK